MDIVVEGHPLTPALEQHIRTALEKLAHHSRKPLSAHVALSVTPLHHRAAATVSGAGKPLHAEADSADLYHSITTVGEKLDRQLREAAGRRLSARRGPAHHGYAAGAEA